MIEIARFRLRPGVAESEFVAADTRLQTEVAYQRPGLLRRTTARAEDGEWVVVTLWRAPADADAAVDEDDPVVRAWLALVDPGSLARARYRELDG